jgi:hypothetical protein
MLPDAAKRSHYRLKDSVARVAFGHHLMYLPSRAQHLLPSMNLPEVRAQVSLLTVSPFWCFAHLSCHKRLSIG